MKNKYLTKYLCITLFSAMVISGSVAVNAAEESELLLPEIAIKEEVAPVPKEQPVVIAMVAEEQLPVQEVKEGENNVSAVNSDVPASEIENKITSNLPETAEEVSGEVTSDAEEVPPAVEEVPDEETPDAEEVPPAVEEVPDEETPDIEEVPPAVEEVPGEETPDIEEVPPADEIPGEGETPGEETPGAGEFPVPNPTPDEGTNNGEDESEEEQVIDEEKITDLMHQLNKLMLGTLTAEDEDKISALRAEYDSLTEKEKELIENYHLLVSYEAKIEELKKESSADKLGSNVVTQSGVVMPSTILTSTPVYYTSMVSNLHAGKEFYLDSLKSNYQITFSDDFASVMEAIEREHKAKYKVEDNCDKRADGQTSSADTLLARNWQDVIAIYIYEKSKEGYTDFHLSALCKDDLARIFEELNPIVRDKDDITRVTYADRHINYYIKVNNISKEDRELLKKYVENDCKLLCATVTAAKGFVRQSVGDTVSEERVNVITAAYSLVGKVGYFWGGKSNSVGENPNWGTAEFVSSPGSNSTGTLRAFGLDCSGFVSWAVINGYQSNSVASSIGDGTTAQWLNAQIISEAQAQPGDLVFQSGPEAGENNHVGILCGQTEAGDWIAIHCSSSKNGVTVGEAYGASFRYIRQPSVYPSDQQLAEYNSLYGYTAADTSSVYVKDDLTQILAQTSVITGNDQFKTNTVSPEPEVFTDVADVVVFGDTPDMVGGFTEFVVE